MGVVARWVWNGWIRAIAFWILTLGILAGFDAWSTTFDTRLIIDVSRRTLAGDLSGVSTPAFAYALAAALGFAAVALALTFLVMHLLPVLVSIERVRRWVARSRTPTDFAQARGALSDRLEHHPLIGHAWREFERTWVESEDPGAILQSTARPQTFLNIGVAREKLFGLKMMGSVPGYFVGVGLLLTFIGLVLALFKAAAAVSSSDAGGMQLATRELLQVATFKFSTSIAGLGASIALSLVFRSYTIWMENGFTRLSHTVERHLKYIPPQTLAAEMNRTLAGQLTELKAITSGDFFARMGQELGPQIHTAFATAIEPMTARIDDAVGRLAENSQSGVSDLISQFTAGVQGGVGTEFREMTATLQSMQTSLAAMQSGVSTSGEDFARRLAEAGERMERSAADGREALAQVIAALGETFDAAKRTVDDGIGQAASGVSERVEAVMGGVLSRLEAQVSSFQSGLSGFQDGMAAQIERTQAAVAAAQSSGAETVAIVAAQTAAALRDGLGDALQAIAGEVERLMRSMRATQESFEAQVGTVRDATAQARTVSDAFAKTAQDVRSAATPLLQSGQRVAEAAESFTRGVATAASDLEQGRIAGSRLAEQVQGLAERIAQQWSSHAERFASVDKDLAKAVTDLADAAQKQGDNLAAHAADVDKAFASAIDKLGPLLSGLQENTESFGDNVEELTRVLAAREPA